MLTVVWIYCFKRPLSFLMGMVYNWLYRDAFSDYKDTLARLVGMELEELAGFIHRNIKYSDDPWKGLGDYISHPAVTWRQGSGDCDDIADIWGQVLTIKGYRAYRLTVLALPLSNSHVLCLFKQEGSWRLVDNGGLYGRIFRSRREAVRFLDEVGSGRIIDYCWENFVG